MKRGGKTGNKRGGGRGGKPQALSSSRPFIDNSQQEGQLRDEQKRMRELEEKQLREQVEKRQAEERRLKESEEERRKAIEEQQRRLQEAAQRERNRLEQQRKQYEEQIRIQREAILKAEEERMFRLQEAQDQTAKNREVAMKKIAEEREARARLEKLKLEVNERNEGPKISQLKPQRGEIVRKPVQKPQTQVARQSYNNNTQGKKAAEIFVPRTYADFQILELYNSRNRPDPSLPLVSFTKKGNEGTYFLGLRKCVVEEIDCEYLVKTGSSYQNFVSWVEANERVEALRSRAMNAAVVFQQFGITVF